VLTRLLDIGKPFAILIPFQQLTTAKFRKDLPRMKNMQVLVIRQPEFLVNGEKKQVSDVVWFVYGFHSSGDNLIHFV
jgi:hypothetical protein